MKSSETRCFSPSMRGLEEQRYKCHLSVALAVVPPFLLKTSERLISRILKVH